MRHKLVALAVAGVAAAGLASAPQVRAESQMQGYPDVRGLKAFSQPANYMSIPGYLRWDYVLMSGRWMSRAEAVTIARQQRGDVAPMPSASNATPARHRASHRRVRRHRRR